MTDTLTEDQSEEVKEAFNLFDINGTGTVSAEELGTLMRSVGRNPTEAYLKKAIDEIETKEEGRVTVDDLLMIMPKPTLALDAESELMDAFRVFDREGNGFINIEELRHVMMNLGEKLTAEEVDDMFQESSGDGQVKYDEFVTKLLKN